MSADTAAPFADLLAADERVAAAMAGEGAPGPGGRRSWVQLALTETGAGVAGQRLLVVVLLQTPDGVGWQPHARYGAYVHELSLSRFPRTPTSSARVEIGGLPDLVIVDKLDDPTVFPQLEPFLALWSGPVQGAGVIRPSAAAHKFPTTLRRTNPALRGNLWALALAPLSEGGSRPPCACRRTPAASAVRPQCTSAVALSPDPVTSGPNPKLLILVAVIMLIVAGICCGGVVLSSWVMGG